MKIPNPILQMVLNLALKNAGVVLATPLEKIPHVDVVAKAYNDNEPLEVIVGLYLQATQSVKDDEIADKVGAVLEFLNTEVPKILSKLSVEPAKAVLGELLNGITIPDFNDVEGDEKPVIDVVNAIFNELAE